MSILGKLFGACTGGVLGGQTENPQLLILGLEGAGKTTLLYRLKLGDTWQKKDMSKDMYAMRHPDKTGEIQDPGYHYEEFDMLHKCGIWEVPGTPAMRHIWPCFYRSIKIHGVIFVVNGSDPREEQIATAKKYIHGLMNEDELRNACIAVIVNIQPARMDSGASKGEIDAYKQEDQLHYKLGLSEMHPSCSWRTRKFVMNVMDINREADHEWIKVRDFIKEVLSSSKGFGMKF